MNELLQRKLSELDALREQECWYLVRQSTRFDVICYLVLLLEKYKQGRKGVRLEDFIVDEYQKQKQAIPDFPFTKTHRALRVAAFFGLIRFEFDYVKNEYKTGYVNTEITEVFYEISERCSGNFEQTNLYEDIIQRQIEKMFISTEIDENFDSTRSRYRLYPVILLYKLLIELGQSQGEYRISRSEYDYLVVTTEKFDQYLDTLLLIKLAREDDTAITEFKRLGKKFDNRLIRALEQLPTLSIDSQYITLTPEKINEVALKVFAFEQNPQIFDTVEYIDFLCSKVSLFELPNFNRELLSADAAQVITRQDSYKPLNNDYADDRKGNNILLYGVPGAGKSHFISKYYCDDYERFERIVFHPDYMNTDFIGQILPSIDETGVIAYKFTAGAFTRILRKAHLNPSNHYYLIIEEINRGNAPAIFGEIFQLLDRNKAGVSEYAISNNYISKEVYGSDDHPIRIPSNLTLLATMNTADQNVFTLDTAFQRRWQMRMIENDINKCVFKDTHILDTTVSWGHFNTVINDQILSNSRSVTSSEDKRLGSYFINEELLLQDIKLDDNKSMFGEKVLKYLWDDAFKLNRYDLFNENYMSLDSIMRHFNESVGDDRFDVLNLDAKELLVNA